ncbi:DUF4867 family protein [uncultured Eubacterium sp.]|uniref:DUF4867 family protein n=1 Tax=uncultured Eubacterium sp. TaxID=165185 RepID=UPI00259AB09F|nr:DUF4867 family protein [uncultured Eubacterium sp.]
MKIYSVNDPEFAEYGKVLTGYDTTELVKAMEAVEMPAEGVNYEPWIDSLEACAIFKEFENNAYGGMPIELGMCWGYNKALNCLEYHRSSEFNIGATDFVLLLAKQDKIIDGKLDTKDVVSFRAPKGAVVEVYATSLHYAPCQVEDGGFRVAVILPRETNTDYRPAKVVDFEDKLLWARNKWLLAHPDASEASQGAYVGITGENTTI